MKKIIAIWAMTLASTVYAACSTHTYYVNGKMITCTTCCYGEGMARTCNTSCF